MVNYDNNGEIVAYEQQTQERENMGLLRVIYEDGKRGNHPRSFINQRLCNQPNNPDNIDAVQKYNKI